jgi:hypothetical protein
MNEGALYTYYVHTTYTRACCSYGRRAPSLRDRHICALRPDLRAPTRRHRRLSSQSTCSPRRPSRAQTPAARTHLRRLLAVVAKLYVPFFSDGLRGEDTHTPQHRCCGHRRALTWRTHSPGGVSSGTVSQSTSETLTGKRPEQRPATTGRPAQPSRGALTSVSQGRRARERAPKVSWARERASLLRTRLRAPRLGVLVARRLELRGHLGVRVGQRVASPGRARRDGAVAQKAPLDLGARAVLPFQRQRTCERDGALLEAGPGNTQTCA